MNRSGRPLTCRARLEFASAVETRRRVRLKVKVAGFRGLCPKTTLNESPGSAALTCCRHFLSTDALLDLSPAWNTMPP